MATRGEADEISKLKEIRKCVRRHLPYGAAPEDCTGNPKNRRGPDPVGHEKLKIVRESCQIEAIEALKVIKELEAAVERGRRSN